MKIRCNRAELTDALNWTAQIIAKTPTSVALGGIKVTTGDNQICLSAFDFDVSHQAVVAAEVVTPGECLVLAPFFRTIVGKMRGTEVQLVVDDGIVTVESGRSTYGSRALALSEYPSLPDAPPTIGTIEASDLIAGLSVVAHAVDDASPHEQVRGLRVEAGERLELIGMSLFRIATVALEWEGQEQVGLTVPGRSILAAAKGMNGTVSVGANEGAVGLSDGQRHVTMRSLQPGFNTVWPQMVAEVPDAPRAEVDAAELSDALKRAGAIAEKGAWVTLALGDGEVLIDIDAHEAGTGQDAVEAEVTGNVSALMNPVYLSAALDAVPSGRIHLSRPPGNRPWQIHSLDHPNIRLAVMGKASS